MAMAGNMRLGRRRYSSGRPAAGPRRGESSAGVVTALVCAGTLGAAAVAFRPQFLFGNGTGTPVSPARVPRHQALMDHVAELISGSQAVLGFHHRRGGKGPSAPLEEVVLWLTDDKNPLNLDRSEVAVLSHSLIRQTITLFVADPSYRQPAGSIDPVHAASRAFSDTWRADPAVKGIVIATGISDLRFEPAGGDDSNLTSMGISLTWASDSADGSDEASARIDAIKGPSSVAASMHTTGGP